MKNPKKKLMLKLFYLTFSNRSLVERTKIFDSYESLSDFFRQFSDSGAFSNVTISWRLIEEV